MENNGSHEQPPRLPEDRPAVLVVWDEESKTVGASWNPLCKNLDFVKALLDMAGEDVRLLSNTQKIQGVQAQQQALQQQLTEEHTIRRNLRL